MRGAELSLGALELGEAVVAFGPALPPLDLAPPAEPQVTLYEYRHDLAERMLVGDPFGAFVARLPATPQVEALRAEGNQVRRTRMLIDYCLGDDDLCAALLRRVAAVDPYLYDDLRTSGPRGAFVRSTAPWHYDRREHGATLRLLCGEGLGPLAYAYQMADEMWVRDLLTPEEWVEMRAVRRDASAVTALLREVVGRVSPLQRRAMAVAALDAVKRERSRR